MKRFLPFFIIGILIIAGCRTIPKDALSLSSESLAERFLTLYVSSVPSHP